MFSAPMREHDAFELFGEAPEAGASRLRRAADRARAEHAAMAKPEKVKGFSWAAFAGGLAGVTWLCGALALACVSFSPRALAVLDPALQLGLAVAAIFPALLFWVAASAAGEALKARRIAAQLAAGGGGPRGLSDAAKDEIGALLDRAIAHGAATAAGSAALGVASPAPALQRERSALIELNADLRKQTESMANAIGRQIRLLRETSKLVKGEVAAAQDALEAQLAALKASAAVVGQRTAALHNAADSAAAANTSLSDAMTRMLDGLAEATRLADAARVSSERAVLAANETANAVHKTTRGAVEEAKRAAKLIRAETFALQSTPASADGRVAARSAAAGGMGAAGAATTRAPRLESANEPRRVCAAPSLRSEERAPPPVFRGTGALRNFMPPQTDRQHLPAPANEDGFELLRFAGDDRDETLKLQAVGLVLGCGVNLHASLGAEDLDRVARSAIDGPAARRGAVFDLAQGDVRRIARRLAHDDRARDIARRFRARPDLTKSKDRQECSDLVRAYLLIDAALA